MRRSFLKCLSMLMFVLILPLMGLISTIKVQAVESQSGFANPEYSFTTIDDSAVSTISKGQVTVIVFGSLTCGNTQATTKSISGSSWVSSSDIRVIFADWTNKPKAEVSAFAKTYGCDSITFCYDESTQKAIYHAMWAYYGLFHDPSAGGTLPFTVLIDKNNQVRQVLTGNQSANSIMSEIEKFEDVDYEKPAPSPSLDIKGTENYDYVNQVLELVNQTRAAKGVSPLKLDQQLVESAMQRAAEISMYYSHTRPDGSQCFTISDRGTKKAENIAIGQSSPQHVMDSWNNSSGHYANIMDADLTSIGIGCFVDRKGICHWVQFFDNAAAAEPSISGTKEVSRSITIQKSWLHLKTQEKQEFSCKDINRTLKMDIFHTNQEFTSSNPELLLSSFTFKSDKEAVAQVQEDGTILLKGPGKAMITASLKSDASISVCQTISVSQHNYTDKVIAPTQTNKGYTLHTCASCGSRYKDSYVPRLEKPVPEKNKVYKVGKFQYKVTKSAKKGGTVELKAPINKKLTSVSIDSTVQIDGYTFKISSIAKNAFKGNSKLEKVTVGANVTKIGANAFSDCKKLKKITIKSKKLQSVGKNALKNIYKKAVISVPKEKKKAYKKLFNGKGQKKTVIIK